MRLAIASDHGGFQLKGQLVAKLREAGHEVEDLGTTSTESTDYPDYAHTLARGVADGKWPRGILVCGTGVGMAIAANRHAGVRAVNCSDTYTARLSREHNDSNVLTVGERVLGPGLAWDVVRAWLDGAFEGGERHTRRVSKIEPR
jgi:ribose 5-phosphate isomerase B